MALPTSTIVMAVLTCIPFGLAIRDTANGTAPAVRDDDDSGDASYDDEDVDNARREAEEAAELEAERLEEAKKEQLRVSRRVLYGAEVATLGSGFADIKLGMLDGDIRSQSVTALETATRVNVELLSTDVLNGIVIKAEDSASEDESDELCSQLGKELQDAWGRGETEDYESRYWANPVNATRASLSNADGCGLSFSRFAPVKDWVTKTQTSIVPLWLVGQPIKKLREHLGSRAEVDESERWVGWHGLGVGMGVGEARLEAHYVKGKVVAIIAIADTFDATREEVAAQLTVLHGTPVEEDEGGLEWKKSKPAIRLDDYDGAGIRITAGKLPVTE